MLSLIEQKVAEVLLKKYQWNFWNGTVESNNFKNVLGHKRIKSPQKAINNLPLDFFEVENTEIIGIELNSLFKVS